MDFLQKKDYYKILEVKPNATPDEIKLAYRKLAKEFHPDLHANNPLAKLANEKFKEINEAYEVLSDESRRRQFDSMAAGSNFEEMNRAQSTASQEPPPKREEKRQEQRNQERRQEERQQYQPPREERHYSSSTNGGEACCAHKDRPAAARCIICNAPLCEECAKLFDRPFCPVCLKKNNDIYIKKLRLPFIASAVCFVLGMGAGAFFGLQYDLLGDYGIIEAIGSGFYLLLFWLYLWYAAPIIARTLYTSLGAVVTFFDGDRGIAVIVSDILVLVIGLTVGWIVGIVMGFVKLKSDYAAYRKYKPEFEETKAYLRKNFGI